ncbi:sensor histidine kinase [Alginatibacterium sediminis]|nr:ATP-binding protein [Alginatibacterium sediminis]
MFRFQWWQQHVLARKMIVAAVLFSSCVTLAMTLFQLGLQYRHHIETIESSSTIVRGSIQKSLVQSIWDFDDATTRLQVEGVLQLPYVRKVRLSLSDGRLFEYGSDSTIQRRSERIPLVFDQGNDRRYLGELFIAADLESVYWDLSNYAMTVLFSNFLKTLLVVGFLSYVFERNVGRHLNRLIEHTKTRKLAGYGRPLHLERLANEQIDELDVLVDSYNEMQQRIEDEHDQTLAALETRQELQQQLEQLDRQVMMGEMATSLAHELNQPLATITGYADIGQRFNRQGEQQKLAEILDKIASEGLRASEIIVRTREFIKSRTHTLERIEVSKLVAQSVELVSHVALQQQIDIQIVKMVDNCWVNGDIVQLQQVLTNLLRNAIDELKDLDSAEIWIKVRSEDEKVWIDVHDNGPGIADNIIGKIFDPFVSTKKDGMGVGLAISYNLIEAHGGALSASNRKAGGATFTVLLPTIK